MRARLPWVALIALTFVVAGSAIARAQTDVAPPTGIEFIEPFFDRDGQITNEAIAPPDSIVFVPPFLSRQYAVVNQELAPPRGVVFRDPFVERDGVVLNQDLLPPGDIKFRAPFISREGVVLDENIPPPDDIEFRDQLVDRDGLVATAAPSAPLSSRLLRLSAAPNPFNPGTQLSFQLTARSNVTVAIYDASGRRVRTLHNGELEADLHVMRWDGTDDSGSGVASGVYHFRVEAGNESKILKAVLLK